MKWKISIKKLAISMTIVAVVLVFVSCSKQQSVPQDNQQNDDQNAQQMNNENNNRIVSIENSSKFGTSLTEEEVKKIKDSSYYVWYEVPELGIRFKVTPDTKDDLRYMQETSQSTNNVLLYKKSIIDFKNGLCLEDSQIKKECTEGSLSKLSYEENIKEREETGMAACRDGNIVTNIKGDIICFTGSQSPVISGSEYEKYLTIVEDKEFGIYLNTVEVIQ